MCSSLGSAPFAGLAPPVRVSHSRETVQVTIWPGHGAAPVGKGQGTRHGGHLWKRRLNFYSSFEFLILSCRDGDTPA